MPGGPALTIMPLPTSYQPTNTKTLPNTSTGNNNGVNFNDVLSTIKNVPQLNSSSGLFGEAVAASAPSDTISPQTQRILDIIKKQQDQSQKEGIANAQSLAAKRGITGSSTEQFGVQQAIESANRSSEIATQNALGQDLAQQNALKQLQAQGLFQGSMAQYGAGIDFAKLAASLTSDELASLRNMSEADKNRFIQQKLGQQGIEAQNYATQIARQNSQDANNPFNLLIGGAGAGLVKGLF